MTLSALIEEAQSASPSAEDCGQKWKRLWPLYEVLRGRQMTCKQAVNWMVKKGEVAESDVDKALNAFWKMAETRNRKKKS